MIGLHGVALPDALGRSLGPVRTWLEASGVAFTPGGGRRFVAAWSWVVTLGLVAFFWPNTQTLMRRYKPALDLPRGETLDTVPAPLSRLVWAPRKSWALVCGIVAAACLLSLNRVSEFLYFQF